MKVSGIKIIIENYLISVFLIILGGVLSIIELLTENSSSIFLSGIVLLIILKIFKSKFY